MIELPPAGTLVGLAKRELRGVRHPGLRTPDDLDAAGGTGRRARPRSGTARTMATAQDRLRSPSASPGARLLGLGSMQPARVVTNDELAARSWRPTTSGSGAGSASSSGGSPAEDEPVVDMAVEAGAKALADSGPVAPADIDR